MPRVIWSDASRRDLRNIDDFISSDDAAAALGVLRRIRRSAALLEQFPAIGPILQGEQRYLSVRSTPYVIVYRIDNARIEVIRVRHAREDWFPDDRDCV